MASDFGISIEFGVNVLEKIILYGYNFISDCPALRKSVPKISRES